MERMPNTDNSITNRFDRRIKPPVHLVSLCVGLYSIGVWDNLFGHADGGRAGFIGVFPRACTDAGQKGSAKGSALFGGQNIAWISIHAGLNFAPQWTASASSAEPHAFYRNTQFGEKREGVLE